jgi:hypothetical protein
MATQAAALSYADCQKRKGGFKKRVSKQTLAKIIMKVKELHQIPEGIVINHQTVRSRCKRTTKSGHKGQTSPMSEIELYIVELAIKLAEMRVPITSKQGLQLANSLINGTSFQESVLLWKQKNCEAFRERGNKELGPGYWNGTWPIFYSIFFFWTKTRINYDWQRQIFINRRVEASFNAHPANIAYFGTTSKMLVSNIRRWLEEFCETSEFTSPVSVKKNSRISDGKYSRG